MVFVISAEKILSQPLFWRFINLATLGRSHFHKEHCKLCEKTFPKPSSQVSHMFTHTGEKPYKTNHKGTEWPWGLFWALKKALNWINPLKKVLKRVNPLFWALKKVLKKVTVLKRALKKVLFWVISSKKCSKKCGLLKRVRLLKKGLNKVGPSKKSSKESKWIFRSPAVSLM